MTVGRVLLISQEYPPETAWGGIGTYAGLHAPALADLGLEVHVLSVVPDQADGDVERAGVSIHRRPLRRRLRGPGRLAPQAWKRIELAKEVARHVSSLPAPDVIESPEWMAESLFVRNRPLVVRLHSSAAQVFPFVGRSGLDARAAVSLEHRAMRRATCLVGPRAQLRTLPKGRWPQAEMVPYPVTLKPPREPWRGGPRRIVFLGRFEWRKGPDVLVEALPLLLDAVPDARLVLCGRDTTDAEGRSVMAKLLERAQALGVVDALEIVERWGGSEVESQLDRAVACAIPSRWESFGYVAAEALMGATPIVVSSWETLRDIAGNGARGVVVRQETARAWAEALIGVCEDPGRARRQAEGGRDELFAEAGSPTVAALTLDVYERAHTIHER